MVIFISIVAPELSEMNMLLIIVVMAPIGMH